MRGSESSCSVYSVEGQFANCEIVTHGEVSTHVLGIYGTILGFVNSAARGFASRRLDSRQRDCRMLLATDWPPQPVLVFSS